MVAFRNDAEKVIRRVQNGERLLLTYRGKHVVRLEPVRESVALTDDPFYQLAELANNKGASLTNEQIDAISAELRQVDHRSRSKTARAIAGINEKFIESSRRSIF